MWNYEQAWLEWHDPIAHHVHNLMLVQAVKDVEDSMTENEGWE